MSELLNKSELNFGAAEYLYHRNFYPPVVHCAYYSCLQFMRHIWFHSMKKSEHELSRLISEGREGSHEVLINQMRILVAQRLKMEREFYSQILQLKKLRVASDYGLESIDTKKSKTSIELSRSVTRILKQCL
jgi:hypothetical protein